MGVGEERGGGGGGERRTEGNEKNVFAGKEAVGKAFPQNTPPPPPLEGKYVREIPAFSFSQILLRTYIFPPGFKLWKQRSNKLFLSEMCRNTNQDTMKSKDRAPESISLKVHFS